MSTSIGFVLMALGSNLAGALIGALAAVVLERSSRRPPRHAAARVSTRHELRRRS